MRGWKLGLCLMVLSCWTPLAVADLHVGGVTGKPETDAAAASAVAAYRKEHPSSADFLYKMDATPEQDYQAGIIAYDRTELLEAQGLFERAAKKGHTKAMVRLAEILDNSGFVNDALTWYLKAARMGNTEAQFSVGEMYLDLNSYDLTRPDAKIDTVSAYKWFRQAAEGGHKLSITLVAAAYVSGDERFGITSAERTDAEILKWINLDITVNNNSNSMRALAKAYREGKYGLAVDAAKADEWDAKANWSSEQKDDSSKKKKRKQRL